MREQPETIMSTAIFDESSFEQRKEKRRAQSQAKKKKSRAPSNALFLCMINVLYLYEMLVAVVATAVSSERVFFVHKILHVALLSPQASRRRQYHYQQRGQRIAKSNGERQARRGDSHSYSKRAESIIHATSSYHYYYCYSVSMAIDQLVMQQVIKLNSSRSLCSSIHDQQS